MPCAGQPEPVQHDASCSRFVTIEQLLEAMAMTVTEFLESVRAHAITLRRLQAAIRRRDPNCACVDDALDAVGVRNDYRDAVRSSPEAIKTHGGIWLKDASLLAYVLQRMRIPIDELLGHGRFPFDDLPPNGKVVIVMGTRPAFLGPSSDFTTDVISKVDDEARTQMEAELRRCLNCDFIHRKFESSLGYDEAQAELAKLLNVQWCSQENVLAIIGVGAPPTLPIADALAGAILGDRPSPYRFRWSKRYDLSPFRGRQLALSHPVNCSYEQEGLAIPSRKGNVLYRRRHNAPANTYSSNATSYDCGMILMNHDYKFGHPRLILLAGHGAAATLAATHALFNSRLSKYLVADEINRAIRYALVKVTTPQCQIKQSGKDCGWDYYNDPMLIPDDSDDEAA
jgi:hypothetical protein